MQGSEPSSGVIVSDVCRSPMAYGAQKTFWWVHALPRKRSMITALDAAAKLKEEWTLHDIRRTVRTGLGKLGVAPHIAEAVLNHLPAKLIRTYDRNTYENEKRAALDAWASHIRVAIAQASGANVTTLKSSK